MTGGDINNTDLLALQSYVTAADGSQYASLAVDTVLIDLTHSNLTQRHIEQRFDKHTTLQQLRERIHLKTGTPPGDQRLIIRDGYGTTVADVPSFQDDDRMFGYYGIDNGWSIHCVDGNPHSGSARGGYEDVSKVEKYRMSEEEYDTRQGTLRDWGREQKKADSSFTLAKHAREHREWADAKRQGKMGLELPNGFAYDENGDVMRIEEDEEEKRQRLKDAAVAKAAGKENDTEHQYGLQSVQDIEIGLRCEAQPGGRRGCVQYVGEIPELGQGGYWVGIKFDEPVGKADGSTKEGKRYFDASPGFGGFLRGPNLQVGDFPERDIFDEDDSDSEDEL
jgi:tubulin-folding cofactor B